MDTVPQYTYNKRFTGSKAQPTGKMERRRRDPATGSPTASLNMADGNRPPR
ncbi:hypothetical protein KCP71_24080 [Salmonella enterica subsp. enterica]|nr:hypothetical protein KCP71_24080 [Salmonella enterica subsp. enterica]